jgi:hypothetical protein
VKNLDDFYKHMAAPDGRRGGCKACVLRARRARYEADGETLKRRVREYQARHPERAAAWRSSERGKESVRLSTRKRYLEQTYGLTLREYESMFYAQGERCAVCRSDDPIRYWTVDHDHLSGAVRGILCWHCNVGLGHFRDDIANLVAAADYLSRSLESQNTGGRNAS